jgi:nucleotidyltransferase/DNA polymerase involved in DNA repair
VRPPFWTSLSRYAPDSSSRGGGWAASDISFLIWRKIAQHYSRRRPSGRDARSCRQRLSQPSGLSGIDLRETPFEVYKAVSQQIRDIFAEHTPIIEPLSLDEAYLDVTENLQDIPLARDVALAIRAKIKQETGLNASAGISYNRFLAKLTSDHRKPNGQYVITPEMGRPFVEALPVGKFHGIGTPTSAKMNSLGLYTGLDMRRQSLEFMQANFGKAGTYYHWISRGVDTWHEIACAPCCAPAFVAAMSSLPT